uniref:Vacuolar ATPase assembly integral membrane protein vma21 n=1 Tax=Steinernema glaseri TaxID=37863 RepID=A0A1I7XVG0_9BILA
MEELIPNFRDRSTQKAVKNLLTYSLVIILVPLGSMFLLKKYLFEDLMGYGHQDAMLYAAIIAVILVHVVLGLWLFAAYNDGSTPSKDEKED